MLSKVAGIYMFGPGLPLTPSLSDDSEDDDERIDCRVLKLGSNSQAEPKGDTRPLCGMCQPHGLL